MEIQRVEYNTLSDESELASVEIVPTQDNGVFVSAPSDGVRAVGSYVTILGITDKNHLQEIESGDKDSLERYVQPDPEVPGGFKLVDCSASVETSAHSSVIERRSIQEFAPVAADVEAVA